MADIPGIAFAGSPGVDRSTLPGATARPVRYDSYLSWPTPTGSTSASPAHERAFGALPDELDPLVRSVWEALELPGLASDYHFLLQGAVDRLWSGHRRVAEGLSSVETFAALDLALIEAAPHVVRRPGAEGADDAFLRVTSLERLVGLLEREGCLREALAVSDRAVRFGVTHRRDELRAKVAALDEELV